MAWDQKPLSIHLHHRSADRQGIGCAVELCTQALVSHHAKMAAIQSPEDDSLVVVNVLLTLESPCFRRAHRSIQSVVVKQARIMHQQPVQLLCWRGVFCRKPSRELVPATVPCECRASERKIFCSTATFPLFGTFDFSLFSHKTKTDVGAQEPPEPLGLSALSAKTRKAGAHQDGFVPRPFFPCDADGEYA